MTQAFVHSVSKLCVSQVGRGFSAPRVHVNLWLKWFRWFFFCFSHSKANEDDVKSCFVFVDTWNFVSSWMKFKAERAWAFCCHADHSLFVIPQWWLSETFLMHRGCDCFCNLQKLKLFMTKSYRRFDVQFIFWGHFKYGTTVCLRTTLSVFITWESCYK